MVNLRLSSIACGLLAVAGVHPAQISDIITCFGFNGAAFPNNTRCPGSDACCGPDATCLSNRLCHRPDDGPNTFVRGPCAVNPWGKGQCPQLCEYNETNGIFPRVTPCSDGSFCCNKDGDHCCSDNKGVFLDKNGNIAKGPATTTYSWGPERTSPGYQTTSQTTTATLTTSTSWPSPTPKSNDDENKGVKIGIGVGVSLGVIAIGALLAFYFLRGRRQGKAGRNSSELDAGNEGESKTLYTGIPQSAPQELEGHSTQVVRSELPA